jgi:hypothetical protein
MPRVRKRGPAQAVSWSLRAHNAAIDIGSWVQFWGSEDAARDAWSRLRDTAGGCRLHGVRWFYDAPHLDADGVPSDDPDLMAARLAWLREHGITCPGRARCCARDHA